MSKEAKLPLFSGEKNDDVDEWLVRFSRAAEANEWPVEKQVAKAKVCFVGYASTWLEGLDALEMPKSMGALQAMMEREFRPPNYQEKMIAKLKSFRFSREDGIKYYCGNFIPIAKKISILTCSEKIDKFLAALPESLANAIYKRKPVSMEELRSIAIEEAESLEHIQNLHGVSGTAREYDAFAMESVKPKPHWKNRVAEKGPRICFRCQEEGHIASLCTAPAPVPRKPSQSNHLKEQGQSQ